MSKVKGKKVARRSKRRKTVASSPASLPPQVPGIDTAPPTPPPNAHGVPTQADDAAPTQAVAAKKPFWDVGKESKVYEQAMKILALRAVGMDDKAIADTMSLSLQTIHNYCYTAGKNGWTNEFSNAKDQIEFGIMPKVVRELEAGLDDRHRNEKTGLQVATAVALKVAEMTIAKRFDDASATRPISNVIAIRIENVGAPIQELVRTSSGTPAYRSEGEEVGDALEPAK